MTSPITVLKEALPSDDGTTLTIAVGGSMGTGSCFDIFLPYCGDGEVIYLDHAGLGYSEKSQYRQLENYIIDSGAKNIQVISIGPGDVYAQRLEDRFDGFNGYTVRTLAVNPETSYKVMNGPSRWGSLIGGCFAKIIGLPFGWLNAIEFVPKTNEKFSLAYMSDQFIWLATVKGEPHKEGCVSDVILSNRDQFFRNKVNSSATGLRLEESYFPHLSADHFHYVEADSCNTIDMAPVYQEALEAIFK